MCVRSLYISRGACIFLSYHSEVLEEIMFTAPLGMPRKIKLYDMHIRISSINQYLNIQQISFHITVKVIYIDYDLRVQVVTASKTKTGNHESISRHEYQIILTTVFLSFPHNIRSNS